MFWSRFDHVTNGCKSRIVKKSLNFESLET